MDGLKEKSCDQKSRSDAGHWPASAWLWWRVLAGTASPGSGRRAGQGQTGASTHGKSGNAGAAKGVFSFAVIGDVPYGDAEIQAFPSYIQDINAHRELSFVAHLGDIKNGSSQCTDQYFAAIRRTLTRFTLPLVYTPGTMNGPTATAPTTAPTTPSSGWTRSGRPSSPSPGTTLGTPMKVSSQDREGFPENVNFSRHGIASRP